MFYYFGETTAMFLNRGGFLGPYLNLLPILTIILFLLQQKIYTPPATDDTQRMAQRMMKFMFVFMGVMFFRVASGLCIYFIGLEYLGYFGARKLLPKISDLKPIWRNWLKSVDRKVKTGFMVRMMEMTEAQQRNQATGGDSQRHKQLDSLQAVAVDAKRTGGFCDAGECWRV